MGAACGGGGGATQSSSASAHTRARPSWARRRSSRAATVCSSPPGVGAADLRRVVDDAQRGGQGDVGLSRTGVRVGQTRPVPGSVPSEARAESGQTRHQVVHGTGPVLHVRVGHTALRREPRLAVEVQPGRNVHGTRDHLLGLVQSPVGLHRLAFERVPTPRHLDRHGPGRRTRPRCDRRRLPEPDTAAALCVRPGQVCLHAQGGGGHVAVAGLQRPVVGTVEPAERHGRVVLVLSHPGEELGVLRHEFHQAVRVRPARLVVETGHRLELRGDDAVHDPRAQRVLGPAVLGQQAFHRVQRGGVQPHSAFGHTSQPIRLGFRHRPR